MPQAGRNHVFRHVQLRVGMPMLPLRLPPATDATQLMGPVRDHRAICPRLAAAAAEDTPRLLLHAVAYPGAHADDIGVPVPRRILGKSLRAHALRHSHLPSLSAGTMPSIMPARSSIES